MGDLTFGEQVKIMLSRKNMTIKQLAEMIEERTGKAMSRQNLTQRLSRDNFQEQDMRLIAAILGCPFQLSIFPADDMEEDTANLDELAVQYANGAGLKDKNKEVKGDREASTEEMDVESEIEEDEVVPDEPEDIEEEEEEILLEDEEPWDESEELSLEEAEEVPEEETDAYAAQKTTVWESQTVQQVYEAEYDTLTDRENTDAQESSAVHYVKRNEIEEDLTIGELNPYTGHEYLSNSVRMHPKKIGYVQVYDRTQHRWNDMTEWAYLGYQERMKALLGKDYEPPIYLD